MDGTDKLCEAVYGRTARACDYLGGTDAKLLTDATDLIRALQAENARVRHLVISTAVQVGIKYAYDHEHLGPNENDLRARFKKMAREALRGE